DVKARMEAVTERVNWSAVAAEAFRLKVIEINNRGKRSMSKEEVAARLQALAEAEAKEDREEGYAAGKEWAEQEATPRQLRRLARLKNGVLRNESRIRQRGAGGLRAIEGTDDRTWADAAEFWEGVLAPDDSGGTEDLMENPNFMEGFVEGAADVAAEHDLKQ